MTCLAALMWQPAFGLLRGSSQGHRVNDSKSVESQSQALGGSQLPFTAHQWQVCNSGAVMLELGCKSFQMLVLTHLKLIQMFQNGTRREPSRLFAYRTASSRFEVSCSVICGKPTHCAV